MSARAPRLRLYTHPACLDHRPGPGNPEAPARLQAVVDAISTQWPEERWDHPRAATRAEVMRVHRADLVALVLDSRFQDAHDTLHIDAETVLSPGSADAALHASGAGIEAVDAVMAGPARRAFCAVRPPGHHATAAQAMGFCLFNNIAVAAEHAIEVRGLARVAIVDFDVHHGNGTEAIFASDARVLYLSTHQSPLFPGTGAAGDVGIGNVLNRPLAPQTGSGAFRGMWSGDLLPALNAFRPQLVLVSAGFDGHRRDPLADLQLDADDFAWLTRELAAVADRHAEGRLVSMLEGGYDLQALRECVLVHVDVLLHA